MSNACVRVWVASFLPFHERRRRRWMAYPFSFSSFWSEKFPRMLYTMARLRVRKTTISIGYNDGLRVIQVGLPIGGGGLCCWCFKLNLSWKTRGSFIYPSRCAGADSFPPSLSPSLPFHIYFHCHLVGRWHTALREGGPFPTITSKEGISSRLVSLHVPPTRVIYY